MLCAVETLARRVPEIPSKHPLNALDVLKVSADPVIDRGAPARMPSDLQALSPGHPPGGRQW